MNNQYHEAVYEFVLRKNPSVPLTEQHRKGIDFALTSLDERSYKLMQLRFRDELSLQEIAQSEGVTSSRIRQILENAAINLRNPLLRKFVEYGFQGDDSPEFRDWDVKIRVQDFLNIGIKAGSVDQLDISPGLAKRLHNHGIQTIDELRALSDTQIKKMRGVGDKALQEIKNAVQKFEKNNSVSPGMLHLTLQFIDDLLLEKNRQLAMIQGDIDALEALKNTLRVPAETEAD